MKNKKLKRLSLINLITGYAFVCLFTLLILLNRAPEVQAETAVLDDTVYADDLFDGVHEDDLVKERLYVEGHPVDHIQVIDRGVGRDRAAGIILDNDSDVLVLGDHTVGDVAVARNPIRTIPGNRSGVIMDHDDRSIAYRDNGIFADDDLIYETHSRDNLGLDHDVVVGSTLHGDVRGNRHVGGRVSEGNRDPGLLDRRLRELNDAIGMVDATAPERATKESKRDEFGIGDNKLTGLTLAGDGDADLDLDIDDKSEGGEGKGYGINKGDLYAYNFPSQGVGAGIGNGAVGAGTGISAGIGAGVGEAVLNGQTVPTLGGVGTYSSVPTVPPGTGTDADKDGLTTETELALGTDPTKADSDGDGYSDGAEIISYTNPSSPASNPGIPGSTASPTMGGVGGLVGGAGAGGAAGLVTGMVKKPLGIGVASGKGCAECDGECEGHGHRHGKHEYDLPPDGALHIMMHVDGSGSILNTRKQLEIMKDTLLKDALLPYYNNDATLYNRRVTIVDGNGERTLQFFTEAAKKDNVLAVVFQDEAQPAYHLPTFNKKPQDHYSKDLQNLKVRLDGYGGLYRGVMFQVDRGKTFAKSFKEFVESAWQGTGYLENSNLKKYYWQENKRHIENKNGIVFSDEYHAKDSGDPQYYLKLILDASKKVGLNLQAKGAGLTDGTYNSKSD
jgi:hypothetical protein